MSTPLTLGAYLLVSRLAGPLARPLLRRRLARGKEDGARLGERLGQAGQSRPEGPLIWLHGASVGEATSMLPLIEALRAASDAALLVTTGTVTSARRMADLLPKGVLHQFVPVDTRGAVTGFLDHWRPDLALWIESELWPRLIVETAARGTPMALLNARLSQRSAARWARSGGMGAALLKRFRMICTQDHDTVARLAGLGVAARFGGNLKALVHLPEPDPQALQAARTAIGARPVWLAASTHAGEDEIVAAAHRILTAAGTDAPAAAPLCLLAPRHPERGEAIAGMLRGQGLRVARRALGDVPGPDTDIWLLDTLGEMGLWYRLAPVCLVGGSLTDVGGHTPFEPLALGAAVLHGPDVANFAPAYQALGAAGGARQVTDARTLARGVADLLGDDEARARMIEAAHAAHQALRPDVGALAQSVLSLMEARS